LEGKYLPNWSESPKFVVKTLSLWFQGKDCIMKTNKNYKRRRKNFWKFTNKVNLNEYLKKMKYTIYTDRMQKDYGKNNYCSKLCTLHFRAGQDYKMCLVQSYYFKSWNYHLFHIYSIPKWTVFLIIQNLITKQKT
jgi:hypothetical protein